PTNCCPSLHVATVYICCLPYLYEQKGKFICLFLWASAIAISTLTTKQHYFIDIVAGLGMAVLMHFIFFWFFRIRARA
ncbi:MAG: phosphatase PAP2 family protein, partial [Deltaproteobacteria bacterium]|nr:phosphatase PAP2 family protein [Deltaproteobacteria bacterium]